jgi:hypothetical protein
VIESFVVRLFVDKDKKNFLRTLPVKFYNKFHYRIFDRVCTRTMCIRNCAMFCFIIVGHWFWERRNFSNLQAIFAVENKQFHCMWSFIVPICIHLLSESQQYEFYFPFFIAIILLLFLYIWYTLEGNDVWMNVIRTTKRSLFVHWFYTFFWTAVRSIFLFVLVVLFSLTLLCGSLCLLTFIWSGYLV